VAVGEANDQGGVDWGDPSGAFLIPATDRIPPDTSPEMRNAAGRTGGVPKSRFVTTRLSADRAMFVD